MNVDTIRIESDEDGFHLIVCTEEEDYFNFRIHNVAEQLHKEVLSEILPWLAERDEAQREFRCNPDESAGMADETGYALEDPKHPTYFDRAVEAWDNRDKTQGGRTF